MLITIYRSKMDKYGNVYHAVKVSDEGKVLKFGTAYAPNMIKRKGCEYVEIELPIREFRQMTKGLPDYGSDPEEMERVLFA